ncbi:MAG: tRNA-dihydrouridine synthase [Verrucomicrobiales bacterium]|nr:tRNA-dihydrouridine synthase [Verrucomicrobiales bacterium]
MQDVTHLPFWRIMARHDGADLYFTEYMRVHSVSKPERWIVDSITQNPTGRPVIVQIIGNDVPSILRTIPLLRALPIAAIDLNLGCPAPVVYKKCAGGGLLRQLPLVDSLLGAMRDAIPGRFTVKTRIGFDDPVTDALIPLLQKHRPDLVTVHGRTVLEMYRGGIHYDHIRAIADALPCPVLANGNVSTPASAEQTLRQTGARGLMIGRGAIRNPWIFQQIRHHRAGRPVPLPSGRDVLAYIHELWEETWHADATGATHVHSMKRYMNFIGAGITGDGQFLDRIRRAPSQEEFFTICRDYLDHPDPMPLDPPPALVQTGACGSNHKAQAASPALT